MYYYDDALGRWQPINTVIPDTLIRYSERIVCDFGVAYGLWAYSSGGGWVQLNMADPDKIVAADIESDGEDELVVSFEVYGLYTYETALGTWLQINTVIPDEILAVDIDGDRNNELVISFPGYGLYTYEPQGQIWGHPPINTVIPENMIRLNNGIACDFGAAYGLCIWTLSGDWQKRNSQNPRSMLAVDIDKDGVQELVASFPGFGLWYHDETDGWQLLNSVVPDDMKSINFYP